MNAFRLLAVAALSLAIAAPAFATSRTRARLITWPNPSKVGEVAVLLAEVDGLGGGAPTGTVTFTENGAVLGSRGLTPFGAGQATIATGGDHSCALTAAGGVACWGVSTVSGLSSGVVVIAAGRSHSCALTIAGAVKCWGLNENRQLGDGTDIAYQISPVDVVGLSSGVVAISAGGYHSCALTKTGAVKCWGDNYYGQLGDGTTTQRPTPVAVSGLSSGVVAISAGAAHTCALTKTGAVKCWGLNEYGQLGDGTTINRLAPVGVPDLRGSTAISAGEDHSCALIQGGAVKCWGRNDYGALGDGTTTTRLTPVAVSGLSNDLIAVTAGWYHSCALTRAGAVKCWGTNNVGQIGDGTLTDRTIPVAVFGLSSRVVAIAAGEVHTCALINRGGVKCWGDDHFGQLGDGRTFGGVIRPVTVAGFTALVRSRTWISTRTLGAGAHGLRATYPGDALHGGSSATVAHTVR